MIVRCSAVKLACAATMSSSSSWLTADRWALGSPPTRRTTTSVDALSNQTSGRVPRSSAASGRAAISAQRSVCCMAMRLGASSPTTSVTKARASVVAMMATGSAAPPRNDSDGAHRSPSDTAAVAEARKPASVMPIWMVARKRLGSCESRARTRPVSLRSARRRTWLSRIETRAISLPANPALSNTRAATSASWSPR